MLLGLLTFIFTAFVGRVPFTLSSAIAPPEQLFYRVGLNVRDTVVGMLDRRDLQAQNAELQRRLGDLSGQHRLLELELERLSGLLKVREVQAPGAVMSAPVTQVSPSSLIRRVMLGRGQRDGVKKNMPVTTPDGLVGVVTNLSARSAEVRAVTDPESAVGVTVRGRGGQGVAVGVPGGLVRVENFSEETAVELGDVVETSSRGGLFPRGLTLGTVIEIPPRDPNELRVAFVVKPAVDATMLQDVALLEPL